jgi:uncharacterized membrane protein SirB2
MTKKPDEDSRWQTLKVMVIFIIAVLGLMALQFGATAVHQMRWQLFGR